MKVLVAAGLGLALLAGPAFAQAKKSQSPVADFSDAPICDGVPDAGVTQLCRCEAAPAIGSVWGSGPYTGDSSICTAARHSGLIGADGGAFQIMGLPGLDSYEGSEANGVTTASWGGYGQSFAVAPASLEQASIVEAAPDYSDAPACGTVPDNGASLVCNCPGSFSGSVWGSGPYTGDSSICVAARHSGVLGPTGGPVLLEGRPGQNSYEGSTANGMTTSSWGAYGQSFAVLSVAAGPDAEAGGAAACDVLASGVDVLACSCTSAIAGSVWGSGPYTSDSNICSAARHAGAVGDAGGVVKVLRIKGLGSYSATEANGERTSAWDSYDSSITFDLN